MKRFFSILLISLLVIFIAGLGILSQYIPLRAIYHGEPSAEDALLFPYKTIKKSDTSFQFQRSAEDWGKRLRFNDWMTDIPVYKTLHQTVQDHATQACLVIQRDTILYEYYADDKNANSLLPSYSIAKSILSALIGFAIQEGHLASEEDLVLKYIPELEGKKYSKQLTIKHLLNMTSGISYKLEVDAQLYYGEDILQTLAAIEFEEAPGTRQAYLNINAQLLGLILQRTTKKTAAAYLEEKIWKPLGMESNAHWSTDETGENVKTYCCLNATALDYAKFGRLFLQGGKWDEKQVLHEDWIRKSLARNATEGSSEGYNYNWHIGLKAYGDFMAIGLYKQHLYLNPSKDLIIVVLNDEEDRLKAERTNWPYIFRQIADLL